MIWVLRVVVADSEEAGWFVLDRAVNGFVKEEDDGPQVLERFGCRLWETFQIGAIEISKDKYDLMLASSDLRRDWRFHDPTRT